MTGRRPWWRRLGRSDGPGAQPGAQPGPSRPGPELSAPGRDRVDRVVAVLREAGVFAPRPPDPAQLYEAVADYGEPVTVDAVLAALHEAAYHHPGFRADEHLAALAFHNSHTEQDESVLRHQVADLARLAADPPAVSLRDVRLSFAADGAAADRAVLDLSVHGRVQSLDYAPAPKYLSTVLHVAVARALRAAGSSRRLAWLWSDQGVWLTALPEQGVQRLNAALGLDPTDLAPPEMSCWEWMDEQPPVAAG